MLGGVRLKIVYTHEKTCFAYINPKYSTNNQQAQCIQVLFKDKTILLWVVFSNNVTEGCIACNPIHSRLLGLQECSDVFVSPYSNVKMLAELFIDSDSPDDQEILEHNAELLQTCILDQLRLVVANQKVVVWVSMSMPIVFTPKRTGILVNNTRIIVKVDPFNNIHGTLHSPIRHTEKKETDHKFKNIGIVNDGMLSPYLDVPEKLVLRAIPIDSDGKRNLIHPYTVFVHEDLLEQYKEWTVILAIMTNLPIHTQESGDIDDIKNLVNDICVEIVLVDGVIYRSLCHEIYNRNILTVLIPKSLNAIINVENGTRMFLTIIGDKVEQPEHIDIITYSEQGQSEIDVIERFRNCVIENTHSGKKFLINDGIVKQNIQITSGYLKFKLKPHDLNYTMLNSESLRHCTISAKCLNNTDLVLPKPIMSDIAYDYKCYCRTMKSVEDLVEKILSYLYFEIHREASFKGSEIKSNVLVTGSNGTGKSSLCHIVQKELTPWSHILCCRSLKGRKDIPEVLGRAVLMCQEHSPAVLICDDVDALVPANTEGASPQDVAYFQRLAVVIKHILQRCSGVSVLMTSLSMTSLHPILREFNGKPLFTAHFDMPELQQEERIELFKELINDKLREEFEVEEEDYVRLAADTGGYSIRDITDYLNNKIFKGVKKKRAQMNNQKQRLIEDITKDKEKTDAFDIWGAVGGLDDVKQQLIEHIFWPIMYPALFPSKSCGILLYGPPGIGKSHIGSCLARLTNMNFIAVKGPELLSKYIGQSEKAIRDVFDKADMKRPCILFFDEFDSLAPKRGHDSTGVTDRVVNQLLARLDGAGGRAAFPVMAATARPDLLDPALLRPGRLHHHLYCAPPQREGRLEILNIIAKDVAIDEDVDLHELADLTEGYSPADLKSLMVTAQLATLEKQLGKCQEKQLECVVVCREDIESALKETKPSLSEGQRLFYDMIYRRFRGESLNPEQKALAMQYQKQRVTLA